MLIFKEMDEHLQYTFFETATNTKFKNSKPFWNSELTTLWKEMSNAEIVYLRYRGPRRVKNNFCAIYKQKRSKFDKKKLVL